MQALACLWTCSTNTHCYSHEILDTTWPILENTRPIVIVTHMKLTGVHNSDKPAREHKPGHSIPMDENLVLAILCLQMTMFLTLNTPLPLPSCNAVGFKIRQHLNEGVQNTGRVGKDTAPFQNRQILGNSNPNPCVAYLVHSMRISFAIRSMFVCDGVKTFPDFSCDESGKCIQTQRERHRREYDECNIFCLPM